MLFFQHAHGPDPAAHSHASLRASGTAQVMAIVVAALAAFTNGAAAQRATLRNGSFEEVAAGAAAPAGWSVTPGADVLVDGVAREGERSLRIRRAADGVASPGASQSWPAEGLAGNRVRLSGWIRTDSMMAGEALLWVRVDGVETYLALDNMSGRGASGSTEWRRYEAVVPVEEGARRVLAGALVTGTGTAWFDGLAVEVLEGIPSEPWGVPGIGGDALLDDASMRVDGAPALGPERGAWADRVRSNARPIRSLTSEDWSDLRFLAPLLEGKRVVQLGESGHGVSEFNHVKVRLIKYLHEELGYDVIAFESGLWECWRTDGRIESLSPPESMRGCIFGVWHSDEVLELFRYLRATRGTPRPLVLAGFDTQISARRTALARPAHFRRLIAPLDSAYAERVARRDSAFVAGQTPYAQQNRDALIAFYDSVAVYLGTRGATIAEAAGVPPFEVSIARQTAWSMQRYVQQLTAQGAERVTARDEGMAVNLDFVLDSLYPGRKVITWGHNFHLQHRNSEATPDPVKTMGEWVVERRRAEVYTIGLYMRSGRAALNNREVYDVAEMTPAHLEAILGQAGLRYLFMDLSRAADIPANTWMREPLPTKSWGRSDVRMIPRDQYDAIVLIDETHPPRYR